MLWCLRPLRWACIVVCSWRFIIRFPIFSGLNLSTSIIAGRNFVFTATSIKIVVLCVWCLINVTISWHVASCALGKVKSSLLLNVTISWHVASCALGKVKSSLLLHAGFLRFWFSTLKIEMIRSSESSVHIRTIRAVSKKMATFITTTVRSSNPIRDVI
jgi:hypothetical protein